MKDQNINDLNSHSESVSEDTVGKITENDSLKVGICSTMSNQLIEDLFVTALEGGSNYWYQINDIDSVFYDEKLKNEPLSTCLIQKIINDGLELQVCDIETKELLGKVNIANIQEAEKRLMGSHPGHYKQIMSEEWDATNADVWFQLVVMQKVIYG